MNRFYASNEKSVFPLIKIIYVPKNSCNLFVKIKRPSKGSRYGCMSLAKGLLFDIKCPSIGEGCITYGRTPTPKIFKVPPPG